MTRLRPEEMYLFLDLETTGLKPVLSNRIIEVGILATDVHLEPLDDGFHCNVDPGSYRWSEMDQRVVQMHTENGLLKEIQQGFYNSPQAVAAMAIDYMGRHVDGGKMPMCGSSLRFDREYLAEWIPKIDSYFHYRIIDVSSLKETWKRAFPTLPEPPKVKAHRALDDCKASAAELKFYLSHLGLSSAV